MRFGTFLSLPKRLHFCSFWNSPFYSCLRSMWLLFQPQMRYLWGFWTRENILYHFWHIESHPNWVILIAYLPQANIGTVTMLHHQTLVWHFRRKWLPRVLYLAPGRFDVAVSKGMPRKATSRSPLAFGGETIGRRINDAIPPALCKSFGLKGS